MARKSAQAIVPIPGCSFRFAIINVECLPGGRIGVKTAIEHVVTKSEEDETPKIIVKKILEDYYILDVSPYLGTKD